MLSIFLFFYFSYKHFTLAQKHQEMEVIKMKKMSEKIRKYYENNPATVVACRLLNPPADSYLEYIKTI